MSKSYSKRLKQIEKKLDYRHATNRNREVADKIELYLSYCEQDSKESPVIFDSKNKKGSDNSMIDRLMKKYL